METIIHIITHSIKIPLYHGNNPSNESEILQVLRVDSRVRIDLQGIVIATGILQQSIHGIKHLTRKKEKPFSG